MATVRDSSYELLRSLGMTVVFGKTAAQLGLPITWLIVNNGEYGALKDFGRLLDTPHAPGLDLPGINHTTLAAGYGIRAEQALDTGILTDLLHTTLRSPDPVLIDAPIN